MSDKILIVDDEKEIADLIALYLSNEGYSVYKFYTAADAMECIEREPMDLAILDVMLPDSNGFTICQQIRKKYAYPVIMLTAKDSEVDKITGLGLGADDYITKPFRPLELIARVKAQLRRYKQYSGQQENKDELIVIRGLTLNADTHECALDGRILPLTRTEFSILWTLAEKKGRVVNAEELYHELWGDEYYNKNNNTITVHIRHLREKMGESIENPKYIKTVWGVGYKIDSE